MLLGLVVGKPVGIALFAWLAVRSGVARLPNEATWRHVVAVGAIAGIGFTVSLFITGLAFKDIELTYVAKTAILLASVLAALLGALLTWWSTAQRGRVSTALMTTADGVASAERV